MLSPQQQNAVLAVLGMCVLIGGFLWLIHRKAMSIDQMKELVRKSDDEKDVVLDSFIIKLKNFLFVDRHYFWLGCGSPLWAILLISFGFPNYAFGLSFILFGFGLLSSRATELTGKSAKIHYLGVMASFVSMMMVGFFYLHYSTVSR